MVFFFENDARFPSVRAILTLKNYVSELNLRIDLQNQCTNFELALLNFVK